MFGSFLPSLWSLSNQSLLGSRSRHCYAIKWVPGIQRVRWPRLRLVFTVLKEHLDMNSNELLGIFMIFDKTEFKRSAS
jgi:hypothetical protein